MESMNRKKRAKGQAPQRQEPVVLVSSPTVTRQSEIDVQFFEIVRTL